MDEATHFAVHFSFSSVLMLIAVGGALPTLANCQDATARKTALADRVFIAGFLSTTKPCVANNKAVGGTRPLVLPSANTLLSIEMAVCKARTYPSVSSW